MKSSTEWEGIRKGGKGQSGSVFKENIKRAGQAQERSIQRAWLSLEAELVLGTVPIAA